MAGAPLWQYIADAVANGIEAAFKKVEPDLDQIAKDGGDAATNGIWGDVGDIGDFLTGITSLVSGIAGDIPLIGGLLGDLTDALGGLVDPLNALGKPAGTSGRSFGMGYALGYALWSLVQPYVLIAQHGINNLAQTAIPDPQTGADFVARGFQPLGDGESDAAGNNLQGKYFDWMVRAAGLRPGIADMIQMVNRGYIGPGDMQTGMTEEGVPAFWQKVWGEMTRNLISPADIALGVLRGDLTQEQGLEYVTLLGINADDFQTLLFNTGEPPGVQDMLFGYRRGYLTGDELTHGILQSRIRDEWIPFIERMRFIPMSTADAVRASVENYLSYDDAAKIASQNGLDPDQFQYVWKSWGRPLAHMEMADLVFRGQASRAQFDEAMRQSDIKDEYIDQSFEIATKLLPIYEIVAALKAGILSTTDAAQQMLMQGYDSVAVTTILRNASGAATSATHGLTRAEIISLYEDGGLTQAQAVTALETLGVTAGVAAEILKAADLKAKAAEVRAELAVIKGNYVSGAIDAITAENEQAALGIGKAQIQLNLQTWNRAKLRATKNLSEAQIIKAARNDVYTYSQALQLLIGIGYPIDTASALLRSNGIAATSTPTEPISGSDTG